MALNHDPEPSGHVPGENQAPLPAAVRTGFDQRPGRPAWLSVVIFAAVVVVAAGFAHWFRDSSQWFIELYAGSSDPTAAAEGLAPVWRFVVVAGSVVIAATLGNYVNSKWDPNTGVEAVGASARGERRRISLRATAIRSAATWIVSGGLVSIGRESAIIETGGAIGTTAGRRSGGRGDAMAAAGIAAAFAAAYHAPVAGLFYVGGHLGVQRSRRGMQYALFGAIAGHLLSVNLFGGHAIFPSTQGPRWQMLWLSLAVAVPGMVAARMFLQLRVRIHGGALVKLLRVPPWLAVGFLAVIAGGAVTLMPLAAGNGMEALRHATVATTVPMAVALSIGKFFGTTSSLGSGAPGGVLTPTISFTAGTVLLLMLGLDRIGATIPNPWDVMIAMMAVGLAVGLRSPFMAAFMLPEMVGDYSLVPVVAAVVAVAWLVDRGIDRMLLDRGDKLPDQVYDEDA